MESTNVPPLTEWGGDDDELGVDDRGGDLCGEEEEEEGEEDDDDGDDDDDWSANVNDCAVIDWVNCDRIVGLSESCVVICSIEQRWEITEKTLCEKLLSNDDNDGGNDDESADDDNAVIPFLNNEIRSWAICVADNEKEDNDGVDDNDGDDDGDDDDDESDKKDETSRSLNNFTNEGVKIVRDESEEEKDDDADWDWWRSEKNEQSKLDNDLWLWISERESDDAKSCSFVRNGSES